MLPVLKNSGLCRKTFPIFDFHDSEMEFRFFPSEFGFSLKNSFCISLIFTSIYVFSSLLDWMSGERTNVLKGLVDGPGS